MKSINLSKEIFQQPAPPTAQPPTISQNESYSLVEGNISVSVMGNEIPSHLVKEKWSLAGCAENSGENTEFNSAAMETWAVYSHINLLLLIRIFCTISQRIKMHFVH